MTSLKENENLKIDYHEVLSLSFSRAAATFNSEKKIRERVASISNTRDSIIKPQSPLIIQTFFFLNSVGRFAVVSPHLQFRFLQLKFILPFRHTQALFDDTTQFS